MTEKRCTACGEWKLFSEYHSDSSRPDGRVSQCMPCRKILRRLTYQRNAAKRLEYQRAYRAKIFSDPLSKREYYWIKNLKRKYNRERKRNENHPHAADNS